MIKDWLKTLETQVLLAHVTGQGRAWLLSHAEARLTPEQEKALQTALNQLKSGVPLPYIIGHWEFFGLDFYVTPNVLIPRPETELLVETVLGWIEKRGDHKGCPYRIVDVGTGSGIIPITLATRLPTADFIATELSPAALKIARLNAERHHVAQRIRFVECDLLPDDFQPETIDLITANLPYIPTETLKELDVFGKEPSLALDGGADGLALIRRLLARLAATKFPGDLLLLEIENRQGDAVQALAREHFPDADIQIKKDLAGQDRLAVIQQNK
jgi:release factor glutamine methyltransferase